MWLTLIKILTIANHLKNCLAISLITFVLFFVFCFKFKIAEIFRIVGMSIHPYGLDTGEVHML